MFQANMLPKVARTVSMIDDAQNVQNGVWLAAINKNGNMTLRMSRTAR
jgi:hypothetical protein